MGAYDSTIRIKAVFERMGTDANIPLSVSVHLAPDCDGYNVMFHGMVEVEKAVRSGKKPRKYFANIGIKTVLSSYELRMELWHMIDVIQEVFKKIERSWKEYVKKLPIEQYEILGQLHHAEPYVGEVVRVGGEWEPYKWFDGDEMVDGKRYTGWELYEL